jgi:hypothetical protein
MTTKLSQLRLLFRAQSSELLFKAYVIKKQRVWPGFFPYLVKKLAFGRIFRERGGLTAPWGV